MPQRSSIHPAAEFEVSFEPLFDAQRRYTFACDYDGHVELDTASERIRNDYLFARAMVGRAYAPPTVRVCH